MPRRLFPGKRRSVRDRVQPDPRAFATRHRFLLVLLLAQVPVLAVVGLARAVPVYEIVVSLLLVVVIAVVGMSARNRGPATGAVALGLVTAAGILVRYLDGSPESLFAFFLALVAISFYHDTRLLLVGFTYVAAYQTFAMLVLYRESAIYRAGVVEPVLPVTSVALDLMLVVLLIAGWKLSARAEAAASDGVEGFRTGFERANIAMAVLTPSGEFLYVNQAMTELLGPLEDSNIRSVVIADDLGDLGQAWEDMGNGATQTATTWIRCRSTEGRAFWGRLSLSFVRGSRHRPATVLFQLEDDTRSHQEERRLEGLIRGRDEFIAAIAEDLRAPIGSIQELTSGAEVDPVDLHRTVQHIDTHARAMASIVDDLILSARADESALPFVGRTVDAGMLCREALADIPGAERIRLEVEATSLWADPGLTVRILDSLVANAIRYGGSVVSVETTSSGPDTVISVIDDGPAIPIPDRERIFNGDVRSGQPVTKPASVGLSLTVARQLARRMDGDVTYRRTGDGHNLFELRLPSEPMRAGQGIWADDEPVPIPA